ncbi:MAG TPA: hypothetical protein VFB74_09000 [Kribbellaceae bacterium]|nr:hypothetical protein [Kribbellaceae bacterium]
MAATAARVRVALAADPGWVRVVWEDDGEEWCAGDADRWNDRHMHVWFDNEPRSLTGGTWVLARNVRRRAVPTDD